MNTPFNPYTNMSDTDLVLAYNNTLTDLDNMDSDHDMDYDEVLFCMHQMVAVMQDRGL